MENLTINDDPINTTTGFFDALPQDVVVNIFSYHKSNYLELTAIGKTCSNFRKTINDKENDSILWDSKQRLPPNFFIEGLETEKQITRRLYMLDKIRLEQRSDKGTERIFWVELGIVKLKELFNEILQSRYLEGAVHAEEHDIPNHLDNDFIPLDNYDFTDMAVYGLVELVQANIIEYLEQEVRFILSGDERNRRRVLRYFGWGTGTPMVGTDNHQSANWQPSFGTFDTRRLPQLTWDGSMTNNTINIERNKIVRRLGYRAGIPEILGINNTTTTKLTYKSVWRSICNIILEILSPVCVHKDAQRHHQVPGFTPIISFGDIEFHINNRNNANASSLCLPYRKVYCGLESFIEDSDSETDVEMEMNEYYCDSDDDDDDDSNNNIDHNTTEMDVDNNNNEDSDDDGSYYTADGNTTSS